MQSDENSPAAAAEKLLVKLIHGNENVEIIENFSVPRMQFFVLVVWKGFTVLQAGKNEFQ